MGYGLSKIHDCSLRSIQKRNVLFCGNLLGYPVWLFPGMNGKRKLVMMDGKNMLGLQVKDGFLKVLRHGMNISPIRVVLAILKEG